MMHYTGLIASAIQRLLRKAASEGDAETNGFFAGQPQQNGLYGAHQLCVRLGGDSRLYRVIIAPAEAPISLGGVPADQHFREPLAVVEESGT